jgi:hypothetical protein
MHTDEYEISIAREITVCKRFTAKLRKRVDAHAERFGASNPDEFEARNNQTGKKKELKQWREDMEALAIWTQRLEEYEEAFRIMRTSHDPERGY